jgi:hypothetical protein
MSDFKLHQFPDRRPTPRLEPWYDGMDWNDEDAASRARWLRREEAVNRAIWCLLIAGALAMVLMLIAGVYIIDGSSLPRAFWLILLLFLGALGGLAWNIWDGDADG